MLNNYSANERLRKDKMHHYAPETYRYSDWNLY